MDRNNIINQAKISACKGGEANLEAAETILLDYLANNPRDSDVWLLLARIEWNSPLEDCRKIIEWSSNAFIADPLNIHALLLLTEAYDTFRTKIPDEIYHALCQVHHANAEIMAMVEIGKAKYLEYNDVKKYEEVLKKSIEYSSQQSLNFYLLGKLYKAQGKNMEGEKLIEIAHKNATNSTLIKEPNDCNKVSILGFLNKFFAGTYG